jgi:hypothetical protein
LLFLNSLHALVFGTAKFEVLDCAANVRTCGRNLLLARTANQLVETRLGLCERCIGLRQSRYRARRVLALQELSCDDGFTLGNMNLDDRFTRFRR